MGAAEFPPSQTRARGQDRAPRMLPALRSFAHWLVYAGLIVVAGGLILLGKADAVLAASIFHFAEYTIEQAKRHMQARGIEVRL